MTRWAGAVLATAALAGCGASPVAVVRPATPVPCPSAAGRHFDARRLLGLRLMAADRLARGYGCTVRAVAIDGRRPVLATDLDARRVDVFVAHSVVYRLVGVY